MRVLGFPSWGAVRLYLGEHALTEEVAVAEPLGDDRFRELEQALALAHAEIERLHAQHRAEPVAGAAALVSLADDLRGLRDELRSVRDDVVEFAMQIDRAVAEVVLLRLEVLAAQRARA
jgi:hypothetical protein